eukprot:9296-Eustigmatos_ZCMA.PRE.1
MFARGYNLPEKAWSRRFLGRDRARNTFFSGMNASRFKILVNEVAQTTGIHARMTQTELEVA